MTRRGAGGPEAGFSLVAAMSAIAIMMIMMGAAVPSWRYVMKNMREEELLFRGMQIAEAVERYQKKNGGVPPTSLDDLVKGKFLRKAFGDPFAKDGKWRLLRPGDVGGMSRRGALGRARNRERGGPGGEIGMGDRLGLGGGFVGVATRNTDEGFRIFNGQTKYDEWFFVAGQPRILGSQRGLGFGVGLPGALPGLERPDGGESQKVRPRGER